MSVIPGAQMAVVNVQVSNDNWKSNWIQTVFSPSWCKTAGLLLDLPRTCLKGESSGMLLHKHGHITPAHTTALGKSCSVTASHHGKAPVQVLWMRTGIVLLSKYNRMVLRWQCWGDFNETKLLICKVRTLWNSAISETRTDLHAAGHKTHRHSSGRGPLWEVDACCCKWPICFWASVILSWGWREYSGNWLKSKSH